MICFETNSLVFDGTSSKIKSMTVWFKTPFGVTRTVTEAVSACKGRNLDPEMSIVTTVIAVDELGRQEEL